MFDRDTKHDDAILKCLNVSLQALMPYRRTTLASVEVADIGCGYTLPYMNTVLGSLHEIPRPFNFYLVDPVLADHQEEAQQEVNKIQSFYPGVCSLKLCPYTAQRLLDEHLFKQLDLVIMVQTASLFADDEFTDLLHDLRQSRPLICIVVEPNDKVTSPIYAGVKLHQRSVERYMWMAAKQGYDHVVTEIQNAHGKPDGQLMMGMALRYTGESDVDNLSYIAGVKPEVQIEQTGC